MKKAMGLLLLAVLLVALLALSAKEVDWPPSVVRLVENNDGVKNTYTSGPSGEFVDVNLEQGIAFVQLMCGIEHTVTTTAPNPSDQYQLFLGECPKLIEGILVQVVNIRTGYFLECHNCRLFTFGQWEYGRGLSVWRGIVKVVPTGDSPSLLLVPFADKG